MRGIWIAVTVLGTAAVLALGLTASGHLTLPLAAYPYVVLTPVAFGTYGYDKRCAVKEKRRVPERTLHLLDALGGWPGGVLAQWAFRHKIRKVPYQLVTWTIVVLHVALWSWWLFGGGE